MGSMEGTKFAFQTVEGFFLQDEPDTDVKKFDYVCFVLIAPCLAT